MSHSARHNPFRTERLEKLQYRTLQGNGRPSIEQWEAHGRTGWIVGRKGSGKTTLLNEWRLLLESAGLRTHAVRFSSCTSRAERRKLFQELSRAADASSVLIIDGSEQLSWWQRHFLLQPVSQARPAGWIATQHSTHRAHPLLHHCTTSPELLAQLARELLHHSTSLVAEQILASTPWERLYQEHQGNLREALLALYDIAAQGIRHSGNPRAWNAATCA